MLRSIFNCSIILALSGFLLIYSTAPDVSKIALTKIIDKVAIFTSANAESIFPCAAVSARALSSEEYPYQISLTGMSDYYNYGIPDYGLLVK